MGTGELVAPPDLPHFALFARLYHGGRGEKLPSGAQLSFAVCFDWHLAGKLASPFKVEQIMFVKSNQGCLPEVQKYNAVIAAQQERRSQ